MSLYTFTLQPYGNGKGTRFACPNCGKKREFTRYIGVETGEHLDRTVGICNRLDKCGYHYSPKQYFEDNQYLNDTSGAKGRYRNYNTVPATVIKPSDIVIVSKSQKPSGPTSYISESKFRQSKTLYEQNNFTVFLESKYGSEIRDKLIRLYHIGTSNKWPGATIFWQLDRTRKVRTGKIMLYDAETGKRVKKPYKHFSWAHKAKAYKNGFNLSQCLFGEHLLAAFPYKPVAIVESEKTAIICSIYLPKYIWLAVGGLSMLSAERCAVLEGRNVILFPDIDGYDKWIEKAGKLKGICTLKVSKLLHNLAASRRIEEGLDLADFLLKVDPRKLKNFSTSLLLKPPITHNV